MQHSELNKDSVWHWQCVSTPGPDLPHIRPIGHMFAVAPKMSTKITGCINSATGSRSWYWTFDNYKSGSSRIISVLTKFLLEEIDKVGHPPQKLYIQADNCARENKNRYVLSWCCLMLLLGIIKEVELSFLIVGHTHELIDQSFSGLKLWLRKNYNDIITPDEFVDAIKSAYLEERTRPRLQKVDEIQLWKD